MTIKYEILHALDQDPKIDASHIGVIVYKGIVTLTGRVRSLADPESIELSTILQLPNTNLIPVNIF